MHPPVILSIFEFFLGSWNKPQLPLYPRHSPSMNLLLKPFKQFLIFCKPSEVKDKHFHTASCRKTYILEITFSHNNPPERTELHHFCCGLREGRDQRVFTGAPTCARSDCWELHRVSIATEPWTSASPRARESLTPTQPVSITHKSPDKHTLRG